MLVDFHGLQPDPEALQEVIMANLGEPIELGNGLWVDLGGSEDLDPQEITQCDNSEY
jgi:hypothetical protein